MQNSLTMEQTAAYPSKKTSLCPVNSHNEWELPECFKNWEILIAPEPVPYKTRPRLMSNWISINTLMLDEQRVVVEARQEPLIEALKDWGFEPIPCAFEDYYPFIGGFHCATLDVRRK
ncbi:MAG: hypothetical protein ACKVT2_22745 [Saprospiraceae bacterium]